MKNSSRTGSKKDRGTTGLPLDIAIKEVQQWCEDATDFISSELEEPWDLAERYYAGETDLLTVENRSNVVKTEVRDAIRNSMPSIMRTILHARRPVEYQPTSVKHAPWVEQQAEFVTSLFYRSDGYMQLYTAILEALKLKIGPMKVWWEQDPSSTFEKYTKVPFTTLEELIADPLFEVETFETSDTSSVPSLGDIALFDVQGHRVEENGKICIEAVPNYEFFISRNVNSIDMALRQGVHGNRTLVTVNEAIALGLEYDDWIALDNEDPEQSDHTSSSTTRRGYNKDDVNTPASVDVLNHVFLLTEAYCMFDLKDTGRSQIYKFYLGGSAQTYLHHEEVEDSPFALIIPIPIPHTVYGHSIAELTIREQDTSTSMLRAAVDNAHASNDARIAADPNKTSFDDLMNPALNAPIRKRAGDTLQVIQVPFTGQGTLGLLQYLDKDVQQKVGITKAAQGLDPDAMQSTDKNAVMNTIATSQGQTELMVRNIIETGLIPLFRKLLKLSVRHMAPMQIMKTKGMVIPVNTMMFDTDAVAIPNVGIGTAAPAQKQAALQFIYQEQKGYIQTLGPNNPFTSYAQIYNTLEDMVEASGMYNVSRYFNVVTPDVEKQWAEGQTKAKQAQMEAAQKAQPMDPSKAYLTVEEGKSKLKQAEISMNAAQAAGKLELDALTQADKSDLDRDKLAQDRVIRLFEAGAQGEEKQLKAEQDDNNTTKDSGRAAK